MKVYALVNSAGGMVEGIFTADGRRDKEREIFAQACTVLHMHVDSLEAEKTACSEHARALYLKATMMPFEANADEVASLLREKDALVERRREIEKEINFICNLVQEEVIEQYGPPYVWETYELQGN